MLGGCRAEPVTYLQVSDKAASHRQGGANHGAHEQCREHTRIAFKAHSHHNHGGKYEGHERHTRHRVRANNGYGVGSYRSKEESNDGYEQYSDHGVQQIEVHHAQIEEREDDEKGGNRAYGDDFERDVALCAYHLIGRSALSAQLFRGQRHGTANDAPALDDAQDAGHGDAANADGTGITGEYLLRRHASHGLCDGRIPLVEHRIGEDKGHARYNEPPHCERAQADNEGISQAYDIA